VAPIVESIEINRKPEDVFAYLDEVERHGEWQKDIVGVERQTEGPTRVGTHVKETRKVPGGNRSMTYEITEHDPPRKSAFRVLDGPIRAVGTVSIDPLDDGSRSRVTISLDFHGQGLGGKLLLPVAKSQARKQVPDAQTRMKELLERE
jgi:polyketide cyclase/dehydrase/lipid transport protein